MSEPGKKKKEEEAISSEEMVDEEEMDMPGCPGWMVTFGDAVSLLMTFFVLILSFSDMSSSESKVKKFFVKGGGGSSDIRVVGGQAGSAIDVSSGVGSEGKAGSGGEDEEKFEMMEKKVEADTLQFSEQNSYSIEYSTQQMNEYFSEQDLPDESVTVQTSSNKESFKLVFDQAFSFSTGRAHFQPEAKAPLDKIGQLIGELPNDIVIGGYADDFNRIAYPLYPSNTHLAIARADAVASFLINTWGVAPERISIEVAGNLNKNNNNASSVGYKTEAQMIITVASTFTGYIRANLKEHEYQR